ncbi:VOC family protein [Dielma fastidiosa]|uniref:VOC family protein n=1 Tax=Dielma fastidiosa TaxID=1034346 RepID=A0AB35UQP1_9FIRM|nr:VOC family protein [Dielma fastidiosa]MDY5169070.1 VOC family protein [Dielma fastidiosa]
MKMKNTMLVVKDMERSKKFYWEVMGLRTLVDLQIHAVLTGGLGLQTEASWQSFIEQETSYKGNDAEIYFEEDDFEPFIEKLTKMDIEYVHPPYTHEWGQRVVRFYDPDYHILEVGESMKIVCRRFLDAGLDEMQIAKKTSLPLKAVRAYLR